MQLERGEEQLLATYMRGIVPFEENLGEPRRALGRELAAPLSSGSRMLAFIASGTLTSLKDEKDILAYVEMSESAEVVGMSSN